MAGQKPPRTGVDGRQTNARLMVYLAAQDPWQGYDHPGKGKGNPHIVPEAGAYGFMLLMLIFVMAIWLRKRR
jgi:hypothetical protein